MSNKVIKLQKSEDERTRAIGSLSINNEFTAEVIDKLADTTGLTVEAAKNIRDKAVTYANRIVEIDRINEENEDYLGICAEEFETYHV